MGNDDRGTSPVLTQSVRLDEATAVRADAICSQLSRLHLDVPRSVVLKSAIICGLDVLEAKHMGVVQDPNDAERVALDATVGIVATIVKGEPHPLSEAAEQDMRSRLGEALLAYRRAILTGRADG